MLKYIPNFKDIVEYPFEALATSNMPIVFDLETLGMTKESNIPVYYSWASKDPAVGSGAGPTMTAKGKAFLLCIGEYVRGPKIIHNLCFDVSVCERYDFAIHGEVQDTILAHALLDEYHKFGHSLESLTKEYLQRDRKADDAKAMQRARRETGWFGDVPQELIHPYCLGDSIDTLDLYYLFKPLLQQQDLWDVFLNDCQAEMIYRQVNDTGILMDTNAITETQQRLKYVLQKLTKQIHTMFGVEWMLTSPQQNSRVLSANFPLRELTDGGIKLRRTGELISDKYFKTDRATLQQFIDDPRMQHFMAAKALLKAEQTLRGYLKHIQPNGRMYPNYRQTTVTGRSLCRKPSLQQIPKQRGKITEVEMGTKELAKECADAFRFIRSAFIAPPNKIFVACDYKQVEYRCFVHYSKSKRLIKALCEGQDFHKLTCELVFEDYNSRLRHVIKIINYGLIYGMGDPLLRTQLKLSGAWDGKTDILGRYQKYLPEMRMTQKAIISTGRTRGYVRDVFGRRYRVNDDAPYKLVSYLNQGTAANIKKRALVRCAGVLTQGTGNTYIVADIHDELVFEFDLADLNLLSQLQQVMEDFPQFSVPMPVELSVGTNLLDMKECDTPIEAIRLAKFLKTGR